MRLFIIILIFSYIPGIYANNSLQEIDVRVDNNTVILEENENTSVEHILKSDGSERRSIYGKVSIGENPLPYGKIYIFKTKSKSAYCTNKEITDGNFNFTNLKQGSYRLLAIPDHDYGFNFYPKYLPTYFNDTYMWKYAKDIKVSTADAIINIELLSYSQPYYGSMSISGKLIFGDASTYLDCPIPIFLLNENKVPIDFKIVDRKSTGYIFDHLPEGRYYIYPDYPGLETEAYSVILDKNDMNDMQMIFITEDDQVKLKELEQQEFIPAIGKNFLRVLINGNIDEPIVCELFNITGSTISKNVYNNNEILINTSGITPGIYILRIKTFTNSFIKTKKVYINNY